MKRVQIVRYLASDAVWWQKDKYAQQQQHLAKHLFILIRWKILTDAISKNIFV